MRQMKFAAKTLTFIALMLASALTARADKIVLKNGRQIVAYNVVEVGDKVQYETSAGQLSIPKSLVDHIEKGGLTSITESPAAAAANLKVTPPPVETSVNGAEIDHSAVHDGSVDREYIGRLENEARGGNPQANLKAAVAHHAASQFELSQGDLEHALSDERAAVTYAPEQPALLMNLAYLYLRKSEFKQAVDYLDRAKRIAPDDPDVYKLEGWAYYGLNRLAQATEEWKKSVALRPDAETQAALDKALRDKAEEESYKENESAHFQLRYNGAAEPALARDVLHTLERHFEAISSELNYTPPEPIAVVLYTQQSYEDITQVPRWVGALNDGRIRVPVQGLTSVNGGLSRVLKHELTHSFIQQKTRGRAPTWLQEGIAQWMEGKRSEENAAVLTRIYDDGQAAGLDKLEGSWMGLQDDIVRYAYAWALANVEYIVETQGMGDVERILDRIAGGASTEQALREVLHDDYADLMAATTVYLTKNYVRN
jgi:tetratricopeptide (TPR) repeat protein